MNLYRFEVTINNEIIHVVVAAENDDMAFDLVDIEIERHYLRVPQVEDITLYEKRKIRNGVGFVLAKTETML